MNILDQLLLKLFGLRTSLDFKKLLKIQSKFMKVIFIGSYHASNKKMLDTHVFKIKINPSDVKIFL